MSLIIIAGDSDFSGLDGLVAGWGKESEIGKSSTLLRKVSLPLINYKDCGTKYGYSAKKIQDTTFCAGYPQGAKDACQVH